MAKQTKRQQAMAKVDTTKLYALDEALTLIKSAATAKFDESIDVAVQLGVDAKKSDQVVRGAVVMPNGTGKTKRVAVFAQGAKAEEAKAAGADVVGMEDLAEQVKAGNINFDVVIASPDTMRIVGTLGTVLGPRGLMPNPKVGTVTPDVATAVKNAKAGQVQFRVDKAGIIHGTIGRRSFDDAIAIIKEAANAKFDESIDVAVQLGVDAKKSDQVVRGAVVMPNGTGKTKRVAVFAQGAKAEEAKAAGADVVGMEDLAEQVKAGNLNFDVVIASPDTMRIVGTLGTILGPRGLMPNPKVGTVTPDVATAVKNAKAGQVQFRIDKAGIVHGTIGRRSFDADKLKGNLAALLEALNKAKPASSKGVYLRKVAVSSTMGLGVRVDINSINAA